MVVFRKVVAGNSIAMKTRTNQQGGKEGSSKGRMEFNDQEWDFRKIRKEVELLGSSTMTWKERKDLENKKVLSLGGKATKKQRLPLSVARVMMKNQKEREEKLLKQNPMLERLGGLPKRSNKPPEQKRKFEDMGLRPTQGRFSNGVLDVKHLLRPAPSKNVGDGPSLASKGKKKKGGKKKQGGKKKGGRKRH